MEFGCYLHHHVILVHLSVDSGDLALSKSVIECVVDHLGRNAKTIGGIAVDHELRFETLDLLIAVNVAQLGKRFQLIQHPRRPGIQIGQIFAFQCVLILRIREAAADADVLIGLQEQRTSGHDRESPTKTLYHLVGANLALVQGLERDEHPADVHLSASYVGLGYVHRRIGHDNRDKLQFLLPHGLKRNVL